MIDTDDILIEKTSLKNINFKIADLYILYYIIFIKNF